MVLVHLHLEDFLFVSVYEITSGHSTRRFWDTYCRLNKALQNASKQTYQPRTEPFGSQNALTPKCIDSKIFCGELKAHKFVHFLDQDCSFEVPNSCHKSIASRTFCLLFLQDNKKKQSCIFWMITKNCLLDSSHCTLLKKIIFLIYDLIFPHFLIY